MRASIKLCGLGYVLCLLLAACTSGTVSEALSDNVNTTIEKLIALIHSLKVEEDSPENSVRNNVVSNIPTLVSNTDTGTIGHKTISDIASLLQDRNEGVRQEAAVALGKIGPPANITIPALEDALKREKDQESKTEAQYYYNGYDTRTVMLDAILEIQGKPISHHMKNKAWAGLRTGWDKESECYARAVAKCNQ